MGGTDSNDDAPVTLALDQDEAVVLFDFLARVLDDRNGSELREVVAHDGELWALTRLWGYLERSLSAPFRPDYGAVVDAARQRLVEHSGTWPWNV